MRKFSSEKAYKLTRGIVIAITILSIVGIYLGYNNANQFETMYQQSAEKCSDMYPQPQRNAMTDQEWQSAQNMIDSCYSLFPATDLKLQKNAEGLTKGSFIILIFVPLIFFGGRLAYKYIFPIVENKK